MEKWCNGDVLKRRKNPFASMLLSVRIYVQRQAEQKEVPLLLRSNEDTEIFWPNQRFGKISWRIR